jgi:hypothetical protein
MVSLSGGVAAALSNGIAGLASKVLSIVIAPRKN